MDAANPKEIRKRRSEQKHKKADSEKAQPHQDQTDQGEGKKGKTIVTEEKAQRMSPKLVPPDPKDGKKKTSRNLEMEGQRVSTINPSRKNRNASTRQL